MNHTVEEVCEYNGQTVLVDTRTGLPLTYHDCGHEDCPLRITSEDIEKEVNTEIVSPLDLNKDDWGMAFEWNEEFGDQDD